MIRILLLTMISAQAWGGNPSTSKCDSEQEIAEEVVKRELSGHRLMGAPSVCLNQQHFNHLFVNNFGADEYNEKPVVLDSKPPIRVRVYNTTILDEPFEEKGDRRADFFQVVDAKEKKIGTVYFNLNVTGTPMHKWYGCATVFSPPKKLQVWDSCLRRKEPR